MAKYKITSEMRKGYVWSDVKYIEGSNPIINPSSIMYLYIDVIKDAQKKRLEFFKDESSVLEVILDIENEIKEKINKKKQIQ